MRKERGEESHRYESMRDKELVSAFLSRQLEKEGLASDLDKIKKNKAKEHVEQYCSIATTSRGSRNNHVHLSLDILIFIIRNNFLRFMGTLKNPEDPELTPLH